MRYGNFWLPAATMVMGLSAGAAEAQPSVPAGEYTASWLCGSRHFDATMALQADGTGLFSYFSMSGDGTMTSASYSVRIAREGNDVLIQPQA